MEKTLILIPSRLSASRLPGKPLIEIAGIPMVIRTAIQASKSGASHVIIATDDIRIKKVTLLLIIKIITNGAPKIFTIDLLSLLIVENNLLYKTFPNFDLCYLNHSYTQLFLP